MFPFESLSESPSDYRPGRRALLLRGAAPLLATALPGVSALAAEAYPSRPIRVVVPSAAGSGTDNGVRQATNYVTQKHGWPFVIENKAGGNGFIAVKTVLNAPSDGYTLLGASSSTMSFNPIAFRNLPYNAEKDFEPIIRTLVVPHVVFAAPKYKLQNLAEFVAYLKSHDFTYATSGANRPVAERFLQELGLKGTNVPYKTNPEAMTDVIGGHVDFMFADTGLATSFIKGGEIKPLAVTSGARMKAMPDISTLKESGMPGFETSAWAGYFAARGTPPAFVATLHDALREYYTAPQGIEYVASVGGYFEDLPPAEFRKWVNSEIAGNRAVYQKAGIAPE
jgi:tripartite-type tricarboxylate transporter receptor subunit TctC